MRIERDRATLVVVDVQERLFPHIHGHDDLAREIPRLIQGLRTLDVPIVVTEQYVKGLGPTIEPVRTALGSAYSPIEKMSFSCCGNNPFLEALTALDRSHAILTGIETHVCVYQTAIDLIERGYFVHLVVDAVGSRTTRNRDVAVRRMEQAGVTPTSVEMCLFELCRVAGTDEFRAISRLVK